MLTAPLPLSIVEVAAGGGSSTTGHYVLRRSDGSVTAQRVEQRRAVQRAGTSPGSAYVEIAAGSEHTVARRSDGSAIAWGGNGTGQCNFPRFRRPHLRRGRRRRASHSRPPERRLRRRVRVQRLRGVQRAALPPGLTYVEIAAGGYVSIGGHSVARRSDGSVVAWGYNASGENNVPALPAGLTYVGIAAGGCNARPSTYVGHTVARRSDGTVVSWGANSHGQCNVPVLPPGLGYVEVAIGGFVINATSVHTVARRSDGAVFAWGENTSASATCRRFRPGSLRRGRRERQRHTVARRSDGTIVAWGTTAPARTTCRRFRRASATSRSPRAAVSGSRGGAPDDGAVVAWGDNSFGQCNVPALPPGVTYVQIAAAGTTGRRAEATASSSCGVPTSSASATCPPFRPGSPTSTSR